MCLEQCVTSCQEQCVTVCLELKQCVWTLEQYVTMCLELKQCVTMCLEQCLTMCLEQRVTVCMELDSGAMCVCRSGKEGRYPELEQCAEERLTELHPQRWVQP